MTATVGQSIRKGFRVKDAQLDGLLEELVRRANSQDTVAASVRTVVETVTTIESRLDALEYVPIEIATLTGGSSNEKGATVTAVSLAWTITGTPVTQALTDATIAASDRAKAFTGLSLTSNKTYTLTVTDSEGGTDVATATVAFYLRRHWGVSASATLDGAGILALPSSELSSARTQSRTFNCAGGRYIWFAWPGTWGTPTFTVNGLVDSSWVKTTVPHTNASGYAEAYDTYRSANLLNGSSVSVVVT